MVMMLRVRELAGSARLAEESLAQVWVAVDGGGNDLDGHNSVEQGVERAVHDTHATLAEFVAEFVAANTFHRGWDHPADRGCPKLASGGIQFASPIITQSRERYSVARSGALVVTGRLFRVATGRD